MDNTKEFTAIEWCAGYGGIQLGLRRVITNLRTVAYSEIEAFACANMVAKIEAGALDAAPIWTDLKTFPCEQFRGKVDLLVAGYPCQPFSVAGKRLGAEDPRHLWPNIRRAIGIIQPRYCFFENVEGHISLGLSTVISDLEEDGYSATWGIFSAEEVGAPHRRKRVFILANRNGKHRSASSSGRDDDGQAGSSGEELAHHSSERFQWVRECSGQERWEEQAGHAGSCCQVWPSRPGEPQHEWEPPRVVVDTKHNGHATAEEGRSVGEEQKEGRLQESEGECRQATKYRKTQSKMGRDTDGLADRMDYAELCESCDNRVDELRLLGNGVVPATAAKAWETLYRRL